MHSKGFVPGGTGIKSWPVLYLTLVLLCSSTMALFVRLFVPSIRLLLSFSPQLPFFRHFILFTFYLFFHIYIVFSLSLFSHPNSFYLFCYNIYSLVYLVIHLFFCRQVQGARKSAMSAAYRGFHGSAVKLHSRLLFPARS